MTEPKSQMIPGANKNRIVAASLIAVASGMVGMAYASVPLYRLFCQVTGYAGTTQRATAGADHTLDRTIVVRFDGNIAGLPWTFEPEIQQVSLKLGETTTIKFFAENIGKLPTVGTATFNVQPEIAGLYFNKIECFCFTEQKLQAGERAELPVQFFVSPDMADDRDLKGTRTITLSYTFFPVAGEGQPVAQAVDDESGKSM
jgi:cytochrome c oxidase assembly protein subunit 11